MKPSDFFTGDWARLAGTEHYFRIEEVYVAETVKGKRIMYGGNDHICGYVFYYLDEIEPIPINGEILTKNGFSGPDSNLMFSHPYEGSETEPAVAVEIIFDLTHNEWTGEFFGPKGRAVQVQLHYIHELQRIMRCMGIDHDIVL